MNISIQIQILYGKNIAKDGLLEEVDMRNIVTRIFPQAYNGRMMQRETPWVDSDLLHVYPIIYSELIKFDDVKMRVEDEDAKILIQYLEQGNVIRMEEN